MPSQPAYGLVNQSSDLAQCEYFSKHAQYINVRHRHNPKVSIFGIALVKKWQIKSGDAGTVDRFGLAFQYQITKMIQKNGQKQLKIKNSI